MGNAVISHSSSTSQVGDVLYVRGTHDSLIENSNIREKFVEGYILLRVGSDEIVELQSSDRQHRLGVELGIVETIQQMDTAGTRRGETDSQLSCEFGIATCHESSSLFVPHLNKSNLVLVSSKRLHDAVDAVPRKPKNDLNAPINQRFDEHIGCSHNTPPS